MRPIAALTRAIERLSAAEVESPRLDAKLFLLATLGLTGGSVHALDDAPLSDQQFSAFEVMVGRRAGREPTAYILGEKEFWSLPFRVSPAVLIPRADSETVVRHALDLCADFDAPLSVLDLGVGSGCLLLSVLHERPMARGLGVDVSADALVVAEGNARALELAARASFALGDWGEGLIGPFDLILCNPPYISSGQIAVLATDVRDYEPLAALSPGDDALAAYRRIMPQVSALLSADGVAVFEVGQGQAQAVIALMAAQGLEILGVARDFGGIERSVAAGRKKTL